MRIQPGCARHVVDDDRWVSGQILLEVFGEQSTDCCAASRGVETDDYCDCLARERMLTIYGGAIVAGIVCAAGHQHGAGQHGGKNTENRGKRAFHHCINSSVYF